MCLQYGLPDESCQLYNATDHTKWGTEEGANLMTTRFSSPLLCGVLPMQHPLQPSTGFCRV